MQRVVTTGGALASVTTRRHNALAVGSVDRVVTTDRSKKGVR